MTMFYDRKSLFFAEEPLPGCHPEASEGLCILSFSLNIQTAVHLVKGLYSPDKIQGPSEASG